MSDTAIDLWRAWRERRDAGAFGELVRGELAHVKTALLRSVATDADAEDALQEALADLARQRSDRPVLVGVRAWLIRAARLEVLQAARAAARRRRREERAARPEAVPAGADPDVTGKVRAAVAALPESEREAVLLRYLHDLEYRQVAEALGASENACRIRVHRGLERLRRRLGEAAPALIGSLPLAPLSDPDATVRGAIAATAASRRPPASLAAASAPAARVPWPLFLGACAVALLVAACVLGSGEDRPAPPHPPAGGREPVAAADTRPVPPAPAAPAPVEPKEPAVAPAAPALPPGEGRAIVRVTDAVTGERLHALAFTDWRRGPTRDAVESDLPAKVSGPIRRSDTGEFPFILKPGWHDLGLWPRGYRRTYTGPFEIVAGETTTVDLACLRANRIRITVVDPSGRVWQDGTLLLRGDGLKQALPVRNGLAETLLDVDEVTISTDRRFWPEVEETSKRVALVYGETTEVRFVVDRE